MRQPELSARLPATLRRVSALWPAPLGVDRRERWRIAVTLTLGLAFAALLSRILALQAGWSVPWLMAPLGASAVLVFGLPSSPLAQPWPVVVGNGVSAAAGVAVVQVLHGLSPSQPMGAVGWVPLAAAVAGGLAVGLMLLTRSLHPPGGAAAVLAVFTGAEHWHFALFPVMTNALLLVLAGMALNRLSGKAYPHRLATPVGAQRADMPSPRFSDADVDRVLARYNEVLAVPRDDLQSLLEAIETESHRRRLGDLRCADIMSREVMTVGFGTSLQEAWTVMRKHKLKALPVVDRWRHLVGIVTLADFMRHADLDVYEGFDQRLKHLLKPSPGTHSSKSETVGQIMTRKVRVSREDRSLAELVPILSDTGHHHLPVVDAQGKLVGILTQTDLIRALVRQSAA